MKVCHNCGKQYKKIGKHWQADGNDCSYVNITPQQMEILTGTLMGDASMAINNGKNPLWTLSVAEKEYLDYVKPKLGILVGEIKKNKNRDMWYLRTMRHPKLHELLEWYSSGEKVWPNKVDFTPKVLKHLYACDGSLCGTHDSRGYCSISIWNERDRAEMIADNIGTVVSRPTVDKYGDQCALRWGVEESQKVLDYMGKPMPGYEYKWNWGE